MKFGMDEFLLKPVALNVDDCLPVSEALPIDYEMLMDIVGEDEGAIREISMDFKCSNDSDIKLLDKTIKKNDFPLIMSLSHRMKGACLLIGAKGLALVCQHFEEAARANDEKKSAIMSINIKKK